MAYIPHIEGEEDGRSIMCPEEDWHYMMSQYGPGPYRDALMGAEWFRYCTEVRDGVSPIQQ